MHLIRSIRLGVFCLGAAVGMGGGAFAQEPPQPPTTEEAQEAYARFLLAFVGRVVEAGMPSPLTNAKIAEINAFARRQALRGCDEWREPRVDPFAPADTPKPPIVFNCTWESGERISLTKVPNTGIWMLSDDAHAAAAAGMILTGPKQQNQEVVAVPVKPPDPPAAEEASSASTTPAAGSTGAAPHAPTVYRGANMQAMPSPYVPPSSAEPNRAPAPAPAPASPMPTPLGGTRQ
jgi:hypothetical protein